MATDFIDKLRTTDDFRIKVNGWQKHNQIFRKNRDNGWFKFDNDFFTNNKILKLTDKDKLLYIALLCFCSRDNSEITEQNKLSIGLVIGKKGYSISKGMGRLEEAALCQVYEIIQDQNYTNKQTNNTNTGKINLISDNGGKTLEICDLWLSVISTFGIERNKPHLQEIQMLDYLKNSYGAENLILAIIGMAYEHKTDYYNPEKFIGTKLLSNNFERFLNLGAKNKNDFLIKNKTNLTKENFNLIKSLEMKDA